MLIIPHSSKDEEVLNDMLGDSSCSFRRMRLYDRTIIISDGKMPHEALLHGEVVSGGLHSRKFKNNDSEVTVGDITIGSRNLVIAAGPCAVESKDQVATIAREVKKLGANMIRGGAYKPRTSPYSFQGLGPEGLKYLKSASDETGLPVVSEILDLSDYPNFIHTVDMLQIGSRNSQNFSLLKFVGSQHKPVLLKNGMGNSTSEWLGSAEYVLSGGNQNVVLCYRGIRSFENVTRFTMDSGTIASLKTLTHLPICADPSHPAGKREFVEPLALAAVASGATMLEVEVHSDPDRALSDSEQQITLEQFSALNRNARSLFHLLHNTTPSVF